MDSLGDRIKRYEQVFSPRLTPNTPVIIRVDGKSFHTWTRGLDRPFDAHLVDAMVQAARATADEMMGFKLGYVQSDEASFLITDTDSYATEGWFGYSLNKLVSITASMFTAQFNMEISNGRPAVFDARAFNVPAWDVPNVFVWRQKDWQRNSLQMLARAHFSHKELIGKKRSDLHDMLHSVGMNWAELDSQLKNGTFVFPRGAAAYADADYARIENWLGQEYG